MKRFIPLIIVALMFGLFFAMLLSNRNPRELESVLIGKPAPAFTAESLSVDAPMLSTKDLQTGTPVLVNFFASWCVPCRAEHENLMILAKRHNIPIIGIAYKNEPDQARDFLADLGNPFSKTGLDLDGRMGIDWGVSGVPETFIIDSAGIIRYRHWGPMVGDSVVGEVLARMEALQ